MFPRPSIPRRHLVCALAFGLGACVREAAPPRAPGPWTRPLAERKDDPFPRRYMNRAFVRYAIPRPPERIASATLFTDVILTAICEHHRIAALHAVSKQPLFSPIAALSAKFPRHVTSDPETVLAATPDLVFLASFSDKRLDSLLSSAGRTVIRFDDLAGLRGVRESIRAVGYIVNRDERAEQLVVEMDRRLAAVAEDKDKRKDWTLLSWADGFVAGGGTIFDDVLGEVGAANLAVQFGIEGAKRVQPERLLKTQPDALVVGIEKGQEAATLQQLASMASIGRLRAIQRERVIFVPNDVFLATTHHVAGLAEAIAAKLDAWEPR